MCYNFRKIIVFRKKSPLVCIVLNSNNPVYGEYYGSVESNIIANNILYVHTCIHRARGCFINLNMEGGISVKNVDKTFKKNTTNYLHIQRIQRVKIYYTM